jgi:hypothetical protein
MARSTIFGVFSALLVMLRRVSMRQLDLSVGVDFVFIQIGAFDG